MKKAFAGFCLVLALALCCCPAASALTISETIKEMMNNIKPDDLGVPRGTAVEFDQKITYDEQANTFTHLVWCPEFVSSAEAMKQEDLWPEAVEIMEEIWQMNREAAEMWLMQDAADAGSIRGAAVVMTFVSCLDEESEDYQEYYSMSMGGDYKITILVNTLTDDAEPFRKFFR